MAVILPFEEAFFKKYQVPVTFVGHPLMDTYRDPPPIPAGHSDINGPTIGLLPGSRDREIIRLLPVMLEAGVILAERFEGIRFLVSQASSVDPGLFDGIISKYSARIDCTPVSGGVRNVFDQCNLSVVASGTATLEAALCAMPMVIVYKVSLITYLLGKALLGGVDAMRGMNYIGLVNLIAGKGLVPELIQHEASAENISRNVRKMLEDAEGLYALRQELSGLRERLGVAGASERTAEIALRMI